MNKLTSLQRKLLYLGGIVILLIPITWLGLPSEPPRPGASGSAGGVLAQLRNEYKYGEHDLGNVDPASSTMNLLLLGFRGIATSRLWSVAQDHQRNKDWASLRATTESIILLQPHFLKVWHYQGWNLAYNVSAEWDGVADRYYWVKEGIKFFRKGKNRNEQYAELYWYVGDTTGKKIGRSDEALQFRRFFRRDPDDIRFKGGPDKEVNPSSRDNYQEAGDWFQSANDTIAKFKIEQHIMAPYLFRAFPQRAMFDHAAALQREGEFGEVCRTIWAESFESWTKSYGMMELAVDDVETVKTVHLEVSTDELEAMRAREEAAGLEPLKRESVWIGKYQEQANYVYWRTRSRIESEKEMSDAHRLIYEAEQALFKADPATAVKLYREGMAKYEAKLNEFPSMKNEDETIDDVLLAIIGWQKALEYLDEDVPEKFELKDVWDERESRRANAKQEFDRRRRGK